jgi:VanZ family protein
MRERDAAAGSCPAAGRELALAFLLHPRVRRGFFVVWCLAWLVVAVLMLRPAPALVAEVSDKLLHGTGYTLMTAAIASFCHSPRRLLGWALLTLLLSVGLELGQLLVPERSFEPGDLLANAAGVALGMLLALVWLLGLLRPLAAARA